MILCYSSGPKIRLKTRLCVNQSGQEFDRFDRTCGLIGQPVGFTRLVKKKLFEYYAASRCAIRDAKVENGFSALRESNDTNFLKHNGQSRNLNVYDRSTPSYLIAQSILHKPKYKSYLNVRHMTWFLAGTKYQMSGLLITNIMYNVVVHLSTKTVLHQIQLSFLTVSFYVEQKKNELKIGWGKPAITENPIYNVDAIKLIITLKKLDWN